MRRLPPEYTAKPYSHVTNCHRSVCKSELQDYNEQKISVMNPKSELLTRNNAHFSNAVSWLFGIAFFAIGTINVLWGNDPGFGVFIIVLSLVYFPPMTARLKEKTGLSIPVLIKVLLGIFILWAALGVGELFDKIDLMLEDLAAGS